MDEQRWVYFNNGISEKRITKKKLRFSDINGIFDIVCEIPNLREDEYIKIPINQQLFPLFRLWEMTSKDFKKRGNQFNLNLGTKEEMIQDRVTPQKLILDSIDRAYKNLHLLEEITYRDILTNQVIYGEVCRRGFKWTRMTSTDHVLMPQRDSMRGWRLASLIISEDMDLAYSNPGGIFSIKIPSTKKDPNNFRYPTKLYNFATKLPDGFWDWRMLDGRYGAIEDEFKKVVHGIDMYSEASLRYKVEEFRLVFQLVAAAILRQHYNDDRMYQGKFKNLKRVKIQKIEPVKLNITIPPTKERILLDWRLDNNVVLEYRTATGETALKKLNVGERELIFSLDTYLSYLKGASPFYVDEELHSLDEVVVRHKEIIGF